MVNIFEFLDANAFIKAVWDDKKTKNPNLTVRAWSLKMGFAHPTVLYEVIAGKRAISKAHVKALALNLKLQEEEVVFLDLLIDYRKARSPEYKKDLEERIHKKLQPKTESLSTESESVDLLGISS